MFTQINAVQQGLYMYMWKILLPGKIAVVSAYHFRLATPLLIQPWEI